MNTDKIKSEIAKSANLLGGVFAVGCKNLATGESVFYNESHVFPAASVVKIPILLEFLRRKHNDEINPDAEVLLEQKDIVGGAGVLMEMHMGLRPTLQDIAHLMIVVSDNTASNLMIDALGMDRINDFMKSAGLEDTIIGRKFMIDPNTKFSLNFTSARDMIKLLDKLHSGELICEEATAEALEIMSRQQFREKIPLLLPQKLKVANKTGEITGVRHDCGIVLHEKTPYAICFLSEKMDDVVACDQEIARISKVIYDEICENIR